MFRRQKVEKLQINYPAFKYFWSVLFYQFKIHFLGKFEITNFGEKKLNLFFDFQLLTFPNSSVYYHPEQVMKQTSQQNLFGRYYKMVTPLNMINKSFVYYTM